MVRRLRRKYNLLLFFMNITKKRNERRAIGIMLLAPSGVLPYIIDEAENAKNEAAKTPVFLSKRSFPIKYKVYIESEWARAIKNRIDSTLIPK